MDTQLPELGGRADPNLDLMDENELIKLIRKRKIQGKLGAMDYSIERDGAQLKAPVGNALADIAVKYNGDWNAGVRTPLFGGRIEVGAGESNGQKFYGMNYQRKF